MTAGPGLPSQQEPASVGELLSDISTDISTLMRQEVALAKAELRQSAQDAGKGAGMLGGAAVFANLALLFLAVACWWGLGDSIGRGWAALVVMAVLAAIAGALAVMGRKQVQTVRGMPATTDTVKKIPGAVKGAEGSGR
jgi:uncharacterized membrane protein YqjE